MATTVTKAESALTSVRLLVLPNSFSVEVFINPVPEDYLHDGGEDEILAAAPLHQGGEDDELLLDNEIQNAN